jgi:hypothetical protein
MHDAAAQRVGEAKRLAPLIANHAAVGAPIPPQRVNTMPRKPESDAEINAFAAVIGLAAIAVLVMLLVFN